MKPAPYYLFLLLFALIASCNDQQAEKKNQASTTEDYALPAPEKTACLLSEISYCPNPQLLLDKYMPGWTVKWKGNSIGGNSAFAVSDGHNLAIAIRGSLIEFSWDAFQNWIYQDLNITSVEDWPYTIDSTNAAISEGSSLGFAHIKQLVDPQTGKTLFQFLQTNSTEETPILVTGHSLGGNLATVYASWIWQQFSKEGKKPKKMNVITFAAPAAGNGPFADDFDEKFPSALRYENKNDIVPKFPCRSAISKLGSLFDSSLAADKIEVGYKSMNTSLDKVFGMLGMGMAVLEFSSKKYVYRQPCGDGKLINIPLSGKNTGHDISNWLSEAGYQHGIARYAAQLGVPVIDCNQP